MVNAVTISDLKSPYPIERQKMPLEHEKDIKTIIDLNAKKYSVSGQIMARLILCESQNNPLAENISEVEESYGLVQINLKAHPHITKEQATDPEFAIDFMAKNLAKGREEMWYNCYQKISL